MRLFLHGVLESADAGGGGDAGELARLRKLLAETAATLDIARERLAGSGD